MQPLISQYLRAGAHVSDRQLCDSQAGAEDARNDLPVSYMRILVMHMPTR